MSSNDWINRYKRRHNTVYRTPAGESRCVDSEKVDDWKVTDFYKRTKTYVNTDKTALFLSLQPSKPSKCLIFCEDSWHDKTKLKQWGTVLLTCNPCRKLPPLVIGNYSSWRRFQYFKRMSNKYKANTNSWMTTILDDYLMQVDKKPGTNELFCWSICCSFQQDTSQNTQVVFLPTNCTSQLRAFGFEYHPRIQVQL
jgi:hypothetical protein